MFEKIKNDKEIIKIYNKIEKYENETNNWAYHNYDHVLTVASIVEKILIHLGYNKEFVEEAQIACILHDVGALEGKQEHAKRSYDFAKKYFKRNNIILENEELVLEAIKLHSDGFDTDNIIALTLILADKLDIKNTRLTEEGKRIKGLRQFQHIQSINIKINNRNLNIHFKTDSKINIKELNEYYFIKKLFKAINSFSLKTNLISKVYIDNLIWKLD